jgi:hypothetical protein
MKRKNIYIIISIAVFLIIALLIWWLLGRQAAINEDHISINFEIHNCSAVEANSELLKNDFLKPLLAHSVITENNGLEDLIITKVSCNSQAFSIPALGINSFRYNNSAPTLKESTMTSTSRSLDEEAFFSSWEADGYLNLENILIKGHPKHKDNNDLAYLAQIIKSEADELIPDSVIIDKTCQKEQSPFLFSSTANFRKFIDEQLKKNKNAFYENGKSGHIDIFIWCGDGYNLNPDDKDNDGVLNEFDKCPEQPGEISSNGCPIKDDTDKDGVYDDEDSCPNEKGDKSCDGCPCPPPIIEPDDDRDGIPNTKDKCEKEFGFKKYQGCPIPDTDGDGINDEIDKCPKEKGPQSNNGCPLRIRVTHNNSDGTFTVNGISNINDYNVVMYIKESNGRVVEHKFTGYVSPYPHEAKKLTKLIGDPVETTVKVVVSDKNNKELESFTFKGLSMICFSDGDCGFVDLNKN